MPWATDVTAGDFLMCAVLFVLAVAAYAACCAVVYVARWAYDERRRLRGYVEGLCRWVPFRSCRRLCRRGGRA